MLTGWFGFSFVPDITSFYVMAIIIGIGSSVSGAVVVNIILNNWFHAKKGFAMGFASTGSGFGSMVFNPLGSALIVNFGYQAAFRGLGVCAVLCLLPILLLFVYKPEYKGLSPYGEVRKIQIQFRRRAAFGRRLCAAPDSGESALSSLGSQREAWEFSPRWPLILPISATARRRLRPL